MLFNKERIKLLDNVKNKKNVYFLSASDRINYGDLLFPIICKKVYRDKNIRFFNYGIINSDLSSFGALPGRSYKDLKKAVSQGGGNILVGGGEVLFADWQVLLSYLYPIYNKLIKYRNFRRLNNWFALDQKFFNKTQNPFPFIIEKSWGGNVFYNAVGGVSKESLKKIDKKVVLDSLKSAKHLSVRDYRTLNKLLESGIKAKLVPDSAIILSDFFPKKDLKKNIKHILPLPKSYLFVQVGKNCAPYNTSEFVNDLQKIGKEMNLEILLCPIGLASGHEDHVILRELRDLSADLKYYHPKSIYDIMSLIAFSKGYIGTSLHGAITAQSYGVPFIPLNRKLKKVEGYFKTWTSGNIKGSLEFNEIEKVSEIISTWKYTVEQINLEKQKNLVYQNFKQMLDEFI